MALVPPLRRPAAPRAVLALLAVLGLLLAGAACKADTGEDEDADSGPESSLIEPASAEADPGATDGDTTTGSTESTTTAPSAPTAHTVAAADAVNELKAAWEAGDQARARAIAPGDVVDALFALPAGGFEVYGCDTGEFATSTCNLRNRSTEVFVVVTAARSDAGWQIDSIDITD